MSQQNTVLIDDIMSALDAESSQNVELIVRNTQNGATKKMALASLEQIIYSYLTTAPVVSNLASVLGGMQDLGRIENIDLNLIDENSVYLVDNRQGGCSNVPAGFKSISVLITYKALNKYSCVQTMLYTQENAGEIHYRYKWDKSWGNWINIPSFYNNYPDIASLASALGIMTASVYQLSDERTWDAITQTTFVLASGNNGGVPSSMKYGVGVAIVRGTVGIQIYKPNSEDTNIYFRQRWNGAWASQWYKVGATIVADL